MGLYTVMRYDLYAKFCGVHTDHILNFDTLVFLFLLSIIYESDVSLGFLKHKKK